jgi:hypothetical protein
VRHASSLPRSRGARILGHGLVAALVLSYYRAVWPTIGDFVTAIDHCAVLFCDYLLHFSPMGQELFESRQPRWGFYYSPFFALCIWALTRLPGAAAAGAWAALQIATPLWLFRITARRLCGDSLPLATAYALVFLTSLPLLSNFKWGQVSVVMTLCMFASLHLEERGRVGLAALVLALSISIKYYSVLLLIHYLLKRDSRVVALTLAFCLVLMVALPAATLGVPETLRFYEMLEPADPFGRSGVARNPNSQFFAHVLARLLPWGGAPGARWLGYAVAIANLSVAAGIARRRGAESGYASLSLLLLSIPFVLPTSWPHYFVYLPPIQLLLARGPLRELRPEGAARRAGRARIGSRAALSLGLALGSVGLSSALFFNAVGDRVAYGSAGCLLWANLLLQIGLAVQHLGGQRAASG